MAEVLTISPEMIAEKQQTITETVQKERKRLFDFIRKRVPVEEDAEDIMQDVFYQLSANYDVMEPIEKMASWLFTVAGNKIIDWYRKKKPILLESLSAGGLDDDEDDASPDMSNMLFQPSETPEDEMEKAAIWEILEDALAELPEEQSEVFMMHEMQDMSFKDISEMTGVPVNTLISRKRYAVLYLRGRLRTVYDELITL